MTMHQQDYPAFFNGQFMTVSQVQISPLDRGFLFGDSVYEVIPVYSGQPLAAREHWQRLQAGLNSVAIESPYSTADWQRIADQLIDVQCRAQLVYVQVSRGVETSRKHRFPVLAEPTVLMFSIPFEPPTQLDCTGCAAHLQQDFRWQRCEVKSTSLMGNVLAYQQLHADGHGNDEALLVREGKVVEAPSSNLFAVFNREIYTPPLDNILAGISRQLVIDIAQQLGYSLHQQAIPITQLLQADEIWLTNSFEELKPVVRLDGQLVGDGVPGPVWRACFSAYQQLKAA